MRDKLTDMALCAAPALLVALMVIALSLAGAQRAEAASLPYVDDVNEWSAESSIATVVVCGKNPQLRVTSGGKKVKAVKRKRGVWTVIVKHGKTYKLSSREKGGKKWKSISYRVC